MLKWLGNSYWNNNMVSTHDPKKTFNVDICGGYPSLVMKMLVYSEPGVVSLLPCKPQDWTEGMIRGVALGRNFNEGIKLDSSRCKGYFLF